jgi:hypothetical protein
MKSPIRMLSAITLFCALLLGCAPDKGPPTSAYLRSYEQISSDLATQLQQLPKLVAPRPPEVPLNSTPEQRRAVIAARREYPTDVIRYLNGLIERCVKLSALYGEAQGKWVDLNGSDADPDAVHLAVIREKTSAQRREFYLEMGRLAELDRDSLLHRQSADELDAILTAAFDAALNGKIFGPDGTMMGGFVGLLSGAPGAVTKRHVEKETIDDEIKQLGTTATELEHDIVAYRDAHARVFTDIKARYTNQDWSFMGTP